MLQLTLPMIGEPLINIDSIKYHPGIMQRPVLIILVWETPSIPETSPDTPENSGGLRFGTPTGGGPDSLGVFKC